MRGPIAPPWIVFDGSRQPSRMRCTHCGEERVLNLPAKLDQVVEQTRAFASGHWRCKAKEAAHERESA